MIKSSRSFHLSQGLDNTRQYQESRNDQNQSNQSLFDTNTNDPQSDSDTIIHSSQSSSHLSSQKFTQANVPNPGSHINSTPPTITAKLTSGTDPWETIKIPIDNRTSVNPDHKVFQIHRCCSQPKSLVSTNRSYNDPNHKYQFIPAPLSMKHPIIEDLPTLQQIQYAEYSAAVNLHNLAISQGRRPMRIPPNPLEYKHIEDTTHKETRKTQQKFQHIDTTSPAKTSKKNKHQTTETEPHTKSTQVTSQKCTGQQDINPRIKITTPRNSSPNLSIPQYIRPTKFLTRYENKIHNERQQSPKAKRNIPVIDIAKRQQQIADSLVKPKPTPTLFTMSSSHPSPKADSTKEACLTSATQSSKYSVDAPAQQILPKSSLITTNQLWGDDSSSLSSEEIRFASLNVNGFKISKSDHTGGTFDTFCKFNSTLKASIFCFQEANLDTDQQPLCQLLHNIARKNCHYNRLLYSQTSTPPFPSFYKPGGTGILLTNSVVSRIEQIRTDPLGRWTAVILKGKNNLKLAIFSLYQVINQSWSASAGKTTIAAQQYQQMQQVNSKKTTNIRKIFQDDLKKELQYINEDVTPHILLLGDFNSDSPLKTMSHVFKNHEFIDLLQYLHPSQALPTTYSRGNKCLDHALGTPIFAKAITSGGYLPFFSHYNSDHRALFLDFNTEILFHFNLSPVSPMLPRKLTIKHTKRLINYLLKKHDYLTKHNVFQRADHLHKQGKNHKLAIGIDNDITRASINAETSLPKQYPQEWSKQIHDSRLKARILQMEIKQFKLGINLDQQITQAIGLLTTPYQSPNTLSECTTQLRKEHKILQRAIINHRNIRKKEFEDKILSLEMSGIKDDQSYAKILRNILKAEATKNLFKKLRNILKPPRSSQIQSVSVPTDPTQDPKSCTEWTTLDIPQDIYQSITTRNQQHFNQAHGSPFTKEPLSDDLSYNGVEGPEVQHVLQGNYPSFSTLDFHTQQIIKRISDISSVTSEYPPIASHISEEEFKSKLKIWSETTTTSPSGLHLGHYKALIHNFHPSTLLDQPELINEVKTKQRQMLELHLQLLNYALSNGFSFPRWHTTSSVILRKSENDSRIHRTRVIHIFEADYNLMLGVKWRALLQRSEALNLLNTGQFGSRTSRNAHDPVMIEILQRQISKTTRHSLIQTNFDATSCYDRIIPSLASISSQAHGLPANTVLCNTKTLQQAKYHLKLGDKIHPDYYTNTIHNPIYGSGQGSGNSPFLWCLISSILFDCFQNLTPGAQYSSPLGDLKLSLGMIGFVDDTNGQVSDFNENVPLTLPSLLRRAETDTYHWKQLLESSGGALELSKCSFHVMKWKFQSTGSPYLPKTPPNLESELSQYPLLSQFQSLATNVAHKTLGTFQTPNGQVFSQFQALMEKAQRYRKVSQIAHLTKKEAHTLYYAIILPSMTYTFQTTHLSQSAMKKLQSKSTNMVIAKMGIARTTASAVLHGPKSLGGFAFREFFSIQGIHQTLFTIKSWRQTNEKSKLLVIAATWVQFSLGIEEFFLHNVSTPLPHMESDWFASLRTFLATIRSAMVLSFPITDPKARKNDKYIMDLIIQSNRFSPKQIKLLNYCRLFLNVLLLSDLTEPDGTTLIPLLTLQQKSALGPWHKRKSIYQSQPSKKVWQLWKQATTLWSPNSRKLKSELGEWILPVQKLYYIYPVYNFKDKLFVRQMPILDNPEFKVYTRQSNTKYLPSRYSESIKYLDIPPQSSPVKAISLLSAIHIVSKSSTNLIPSRKSTTDVKTDIEVPTSIHMSPRIFDIIKSQTLNITAVSDGSVKNQQGTFGWILADEQHGVLARGKGRLSTKNPTSYRAEGWGIVSLLRFLTRLEDASGIRMSSNLWTLACDNQAIINQISQIHQALFKDSDSPQYQVQQILNNTLMTDWDILNELNKLSPILSNCQILHVKGHQDSSKHSQPLSFVARMNVQADLLAEQAHQLPLTSTFLLLKSSTINLITPQGQITGNWVSNLRYTRSSQEMARYMITKYSWSEAIFTDINWEVLKKLLQSFPNRRLCVIKFTNGLIPTNYILHRNKTCPSPLCPMCNTEVETWQHLNLCQAEFPIIWRTHLVRKLQDKCKELKTSPECSSALMHGLNSIFNFAPLDEFPLINEVAVSLHHAQHQLGWLQFLQGKATKQWEEVNAHYSPSKAEPQQIRSKKSWTYCILYLLWSQWIELWDYRNATIHGHNPAEAKEKERQNMLQELQTFVANRHKMQYNIKITLPPQNTVLTWSQLKTWFSMYGPSVRNHLETFTARVTQGMKKITSYFSVPSQSPQSASQTVLDMPQVTSSGRRNGNISKLNISQHTLHSQPFSTQQTSTSVNNKERKVKGCIPNSTTTVSDSDSTIDTVLKVTNDEEHARIIINKTSHKSYAPTLPNEFYQAKSFPKQQTTISINEYFQDKMAPPWNKGASPPSQNPRTISSNLTNVYYQDTTAPPWNKGALPPSQQFRPLSTDSPPNIHQG